MKEIQVKFQDKFFNLELEVKKRDDIISKLQHRILEMEREQQDQQLVALRAYDDDGNEDEDVLVFQQQQQQQRQGSSGSGTSRSSDELPFMVSLSLFAIFDSLYLFKLSVVHVCHERKPYTELVYQGSIMCCIAAIIRRVVDLAVCALCAS